MQISLFLLSLLCAIGSPALPVSNHGSQPTALLEWLTETDHDFGTLKKDHPAWFAFKYKNISNAPLVLETVRTTCGCTAASWTEEAILPGETGVINIEYDAYHGGTFRKKIKVFFKEQKKAETLWIGGDVE
jgi:hypothetical protein